MQSRFRKALLGVVLFAAILIAFLAFQVVRFNQPLASLQNERIFQVEPGSSLTRIANELAEQGIYSSPFLFRLALLP